MLKAGLPDEATRLASLHHRLQHGGGLLRTAAWKMAHPRQRVILYGPAVFSNPYQTLLYSAFGSRMSVSGPKRSVMYRSLGIAQVYHLHWDEFHLAAGSSNDRLPSYCAPLSAFRAGGGKLIWTVHNAQAHTRMTPEREALFHAGRAFLCREADLIHVHGAAARDLIVGRYDADPARIEIIAHPSYAGWYPPPPPRPDPATAGRRFLVFGSFRENKGLDLILEGLRRAARNTAVGEVHVAGRGAEQVGQDTVPGCTLRVSPGFVPDAEVSTLFGVADFCIFGFSSILTSGSLMLALTFGTVPIVPDLPTLREILPAPLRQLSFVPGDADDLARAVSTASQMNAGTLEHLRALALDVAQECHPGSVSARLEAAIDRLF